MKRTKLWKLLHYHAINLMCSRICEVSMFQSKLQRLGKQHTIYVCSRQMIFVNSPRQRIIHVSVASTDTIEAGCSAKRSPVSITLDEYRILQLIPSSCNQVDCVLRCIDCVRCACYCCCCCCWQFLPVLSWAFIFLSNGFSLF